MRRLDISADREIDICDVGILVNEPCILTFTWGFGGDVKVMNNSDGDVTIVNDGRYGEDDLPYTLASGKEASFYFDYGYHRVGKDDVISTELENVSNSVDGNLDASNFTGDFLNDLNSGTIPPDNTVTQDKTTFIDKEFLNLFDMSVSGLSSNGLTLTINDGVVSISGTATSTSSLFFVASEGYQLSAGTYYLHMDTQSEKSLILTYSIDGGTYVNEGIPDLTDALEIDNTGTLDLIRFIVNTSVGEVWDETFNVSINEDESISFVPPSTPNYTFGPETKISEENFEEPLAIEYSNLKSDVEDLKNANTLKIPELFMPDTIYARVGQQTSVYYENIILYSDLIDTADYYIKAKRFKGETQEVMDSTVGIQMYDYKIDYTALTAESWTLTIDIIKLYTQEVVSSVSVDVVAFDESDLSLTDISVLYLGDSYGDGFGVSSETYNNLNSIFNSVTYVGTRETDIVDVYDECYGGWSTGTFVDQAETAGVTNPFWNPVTEAFDFDYYMSTYHPTYTPHGGGGDELDVFIITTGINDVIYLAPGATVDYRLASIVEIITSVKAWDSDIKFVISTINPLYRNGSAFESGAGEGTWQRATHAIEYANWHLINNNPYDSDLNVYLADTCADFDARYGLLTATVNPNRYNASYEEIIASDIHPSSDGVCYLADNYTSFICQTMR